MNTPSLLGFSALLVLTSAASAQREARAPFRASELDEARQLVVLESDHGAIARAANQRVLGLEDVLLPDGSQVDVELERIPLGAMEFAFQVDGVEAPGLLAGLDLSVWKGSVVGDPHSEVLLSFSQVGNRGWIRRHDQTFHVMPQPDNARGWGHSYAYLIESEALTRLGMDLGMTCGSDEIPGNALFGDEVPRGPVQEEEHGVFELRSTSRTVYECAVAVETDFQLNQVFGGDLAAETAFVTTLLAAASDRYFEQLDTRLTYPYVQFYTSSSDPWSTPETTDAGTGDMLNEFVSAWGGAPLPGNANLGHFLSGASLGGGVAYLGVLCDTNFDFTFGVSANLDGGTPFPVQQGPLNWEFVVLTHELGHNFSTPHTHDYCPPIDECAPDNFGPDMVNLQGACQAATVCTNSGTIMSYCHLCPGGIGNITTFFHPTVVDTIEPHVMGCLPPAAGITTVAPAVLAPAAPTPVTASVLGTVVGNVELHYRASAGEGFTFVAMSNLGGGTYGADLPAFDCGEAPEFFFQYEESSFGLLQTEVCVAQVAQQTFVFADDFQSDQGWVVGDPSDTATTGIWERVDPNGTSAQPEVGVDTGTGPVCYVTGQGTVGGSVGENDVDNGTTTLISPVVDLSTGDAEISYWRWYSNNAGASPSSDVFVVEVTNNGSTWVEVETVGPDGPEANGGWVNHTFLVSDFVSPSAGVRVRFRAEDAGSGSIVEAGVDSFEVYRLDCEVCQPDLGFGGPGSMTLSVCGEALTPLGAATLELTGAPSLVPAVIFYSTSFNPTNLLGGTFVPLPIGGSVLRNTDIIGQLSIPILGSTASGTFYVQAAVSDMGTVLFSNAIQMDFQ